MRAAVLVLAALATSACGTSPAPRFYTLETGRSTAGAAGVSVYVGAVSVPEAIDRPQLVLRKSPAEVVVLDGHRWAEPLKVAIGRVLAAQLAEALDSTRVGAFPGTVLADAAYRVQVDVLRLDADPNAAASVEAIWSVRRADDNATIAGRSSGSAPAAGGYEALARAHVAALRSVSLDLARAIRALQDRPRSR